MTNITSRAQAEVAATARLMPILSRAAGHLRHRRGAPVPAGTTGAERPVVVWILLIIAGMFEVLWASLLAETDGFRRLWPTLGFIASLSVSMVLLAIAVRTLPVGTAYAVWVGIGAVGTVLVGITVRHQATSLANMAALGALVASIVAVKLTAPH